MRIQVDRKIYTATSTIGELSIDGKFLCYTLEDTVRQPSIKVYGKTAIPSGAYEVSLTYSPKFKRIMPLLNGVPGFEGVRIHKGNTDKDTEGCLLLGRTKGDDFIGESALAFDAFYPLLEAAIKAREHVVLVLNDTYAEPPTATAPAKSAAKESAKKGDGEKS